jgi:hypothetical protein
VPFVIPVRSLRGPLGLEAFAAAAGAEAWFFEAALKRGDALLLVDGLDEARRELVGAVLPALNALLDEYPQVRAVVTTRPAEEEAAPPGFAQVKLTAMTRDEVNDLIDRWCLAAELSLKKGREQAEADARAAAQDLKERVRARRAIEKLAQTPLLCSVICVVHRFLGQQIPQRRVVLYEAITNVLLYEWDKAKFPDPEGVAIGKLDAAAKRALLARLACAMHEDKRAELPENEVVARFAAHLPDLGRPREEAQAIVEEIRDRSGVLVERSPGSFAFSHMSFQEYLTAMELVKGREYGLLVDEYEDKWWHEVIVLAAGFPGADAAGLVQGLLDKDGEEVDVGTMLAAQCAETAIELSAALREKIEARVDKLMPPNGINDADQIFSLGDVAGPVLMQSIKRANGARQRIYTLIVLGWLEYEPALGVIVEHLSDSSFVKPPVVTDDREVELRMYVSTYAAQAACDLLQHSDSVFPALMRAIPYANAHAITGIRDYMRSRGLSRHEQLRALLRRYEEYHPQTTSSRARSPKRAARSG